ncbi:energy-coupling factor ABC transporter permease [Quadrisphaera sp. GCM10027208]|uniref:energy-coupling factor ABC transporter permease n=1 Tax=Quadrisphaera sp. GCM10027208 TaxID=3273423 RepID=UPI00362090A5
MHVPDGFLDVPTSLATGAVAAGAVGLALQRAGAQLRTAGAPMAGLTAAFVFATQMVNFPVGPGTSGHLMGGALAAALVGPWAGLLAVAVVVVVQALLFADGGLTALGTNVTLIAVVTVAVGWAVTRAVLAVLPPHPGSVVPAVAVGAFVSVPATALAFTGLYAVGGAVSIPIGTLAAAMLGWHTLIGIGEAVITAAVVGAVVATRPDLVHAARHVRRQLVLVDAEGRQRTVTADTVPTAVEQRSGRGLLATLLAVSLLVGGGLSLLASGNPDGLEYVGERLGFAGAAHDSAVAGSPLADYGVSGLGSLGAVLAGVLGVLITLAVAAGVGRLVAARRRPPDRAEDVRRAGR